VRCASQRLGGARGAKTVAEITNSGGKASFIAADLADAADAQWLASNVGDVDILINHAGVALFGPTAEFDVAAFDRMFASNVWAARRTGGRRPRSRR
jgi:NAD(P)-dependent dehydrogenase (short-subunit alcohol dehydrogenase family)